MSSVTFPTFWPRHGNLDIPLSEENIRIRVNAYVNSYVRKRDCGHHDPQQCNCFLPGNEVTKKRIITNLLGRSEPVTERNFSTAYQEANLDALPWGSFERMGLGHLPQTTTQVIFQKIKTPALIVGLTALIILTLFGTYFLASRIF